MVIAFLSSINFVPKCNILSPDHIEKAKTLEQIIFRCPEKYTISSGLGLTPPSHPVAGPASAGGGGGGADGDDADALLRKLRAL